MKRIIITVGVLLTLMVTVGVASGCSAKPEYKLWTDGSSLEQISYTVPGAVVSVTIPEGITEIKSMAAEQLMNATSVTLPSTLTKIEGYASAVLYSRIIEIYDLSDHVSLETSQYGELINKNLKKVHYSKFEKSVLTKKDGFAYYVTDTEALLVGFTEKSNTLTIPSEFDGKPCKLAVGAFANAEIKEIKLSEGITELSEACFSITKAEKIELPSTLTDVGINAFYNCFITGTVELPSSVKNIGSYAFSSANIGKLVLPEGIETIENELLINSEIGTLCIPSTLTTLANQIDRLMKVTQAYEVHPDNQYYCSVDGVLFDKNREILLDYPEEGTEIDYTVPSTVTEVGNYAFHGNKYLQYLTFTKGVEKIGDYAFNGAEMLETVVFSETVTVIGGTPFNHCNALKNIIVHENNPNYTAIDGVLFNKSLTELICYPPSKTNTEYIVPETVTVIHASAFNESCLLTKVTLPEGIKSVGPYAFFRYDAEPLTVIIPTTPREIGYNAFCNCQLITPQPQE